ncbi:MAG: hypothetical protein U0183_01115 [Polyangiaceae bacterium]
MELASPGSRLNDVAQGTAHLLGRDRPLLGGGLDHRRYGRAEPRVEVGAQDVERDDLRLGHRAEDLDLGERAPLDRLAVREHFPEQHPRRVDVRVGADVAPGHLLGRHVAEGALDEPGLRVRAHPGDARDAEVRELHLAVPPHEHVRRVHVAVDDRRFLPLSVDVAVGRSEGVEHAIGHVQRGKITKFLARVLERRAEPVEGHPVDELEHHDELLVLREEVEEAHDRRVREPRVGGRLPREHARELRVVPVLREEQLEHDLTLEPERPLGLRQQDITRPSRRDAAEHTVATQPVERFLRIHPARFGNQRTGSLFPAQVCFGPRSGSRSASISEAREPWRTRARPVGPKR